MKRMGSGKSKKLVDILGTTTPAPETTRPPRPSGNAYRERTPREVLAVQWVGSRNSQRQVEQLVPEGSVEIADDGTLLIKVFDGRPEKMRPGFSWAHYQERRKTHDIDELVVVPLLSFVVRRGGKVWELTPEQFAAEYEQAVV